MPEEEKSFYQTGEKPPHGIYVCGTCGNKTVLVPDLVKRLPECPCCGFTLWYKAVSSDG